MRLANRVAIVTGAASGIGAAILSAALTGQSINVSHGWNMG